MDGKVMNISDYKKKDIFDVVTHDTVPLLPKLINAVSSFYATPSRSYISAPESWNPTIKYRTFKFDPYMIGFDEQVSDKSEYFTQRSGEKSMQAVIEVFDYIKKQMETKKVHLTLNEVHYAEHYIVTKEEVGKNSIIIGFFYLKDNYYERFLIKDLKKFCKAVSLTGNISKKILKKWKPIDEMLTVEESLQRMLDSARPFVESARGLPIQDIYINEMIQYFSESKCKVISML